MRAALIFLVLGFFGLLLVMGTLGFVRWLKASYLRHFRVMLLTILPWTGRLGHLGLHRGERGPDLLCGAPLTSVLEPSCLLLMLTAMVLLNILR